MRLALIVVGMLGSLLVAAGPAAAETPVTWPAPADPLSKLDALVLFGGGTLGLIVLLTLLGLWAGRHNYSPPDPSTEIHVQRTIETHH